MSSGTEIFLNNIKKALFCRCPKCGDGKIFKSTLELHKNCSSCGLPLAENDNGDGPAVFLIFILGFLLVPLALWVDFLFKPDLWVHAILWSVIGIGVTVGLLRPVKAYVLVLEYYHRPDMWEKKKKKKKS